MTTIKMNFATRVSGKSRAVEAVGLNTTEIRKVNGEVPQATVKWKEGATLVAPSIYLRAASNILTSTCTVLAFQSLKHPVIRPALTMALEYDHYLALYTQCHSLYEQQKSGMNASFSAPTTSPTRVHLATSRSKVPSCLSGQETIGIKQRYAVHLQHRCDFKLAHSESQEFRIDAERRHQVTKGILEKAESTSEEDNNAMDELRKKLDESLEWQADGTTAHMPTNSIGAQSPARTGRLKDFLYARYKREHPGEDPPTRWTVEG